MLFSSIPFLYYFLPCVVILYLLAPKPAKNSVLLLASLVFYAWGEKKLVVLMIAAILLSYIFGLLIEKYKDRKNLSRLFLILSVVTSLAMLFYYKYTDFFIYNFNAITGLSVPLLKIALPIGISFYTFQCLSYTVDVYRGDVPAQKDFIALATYVALFPQLIAGPIVRYSDVALQLNERTHSFEKVSYGIRRFVIGLSKKILIADALGELCDIFKSSGDKSVLFFWLYAIAFTLHIYFDFSGYSDMAIGLGKMFGFDFLENFNYPYISKSATEFWRRWHMSLGSWFRDYIYIPLGGNRVSKLGHIRNIFIVWFATGFWHGAAWNFIIWGLYFGVILVVEKFWLMKYLKKSKVWSHIYLLFTVVISFVIFNAADMAEAFRYIGGMFGIGGYSLVSAESVYYLRSYGFLFILGFIGSTPLLKNLTAKIREKSLTAEKILNVAEPIVMVVLLVVVTAFPVYGSFSPFLYFRF